MKDKQKLQLAENILEMYDSLQIAIDQAGGCGMSSEKLSEMTVLELMVHLSPNKIRFIFDPKNYLEHEKSK